MNNTTRSLLAACIALGFGFGASEHGFSDGLLNAEPLEFQQQVDQVALALRNPGSHPRVGLPDFIVSSADADTVAAAKTVAEVLWNDLDFEREYAMISRASSAQIPVTPVESLPYDRWIEVGADLVLAGSARVSDRTLVIQLRLVSVRGDTRGRQYFGREYRCGMQTARGPRDCAHQIADDFHKENRNLDGVARTKLAFASDRDSARVAGRPDQAAGISKEIYLSDYDGANQIRLTTNRSINISPSWSPTGGLLAYTSYSSRYPDIYVANLAQPGRELERPAQGTEAVHNQLSAWSPDGTMLAYMSNRSGNNDIWIVNRDGSGRRNLTNTPNSSEGSPTWSPTGQMIAFTSDRAGIPQLYVMNITGTGLERLTSDRADRPTWSPLNFIAFTAGNTATGFDIAIWDFNNSGVRVLTSGAGLNESPAVSPSGRHIAFMTTRWGRQEIAVMDRTGSNIRRITQTGNNTYPNWQPFVGR